MNKMNLRSPITQWAEDDKPREKLLKLGRTSLTNSELIAILLGSGLPGLSAVDVAKSLLLNHNNDLNDLAKSELVTLMKTKGIGEAKAVTIIAALELGRRQNAMVSVEKEKITSSYMAYLELSKYLLDLVHEEFWILILNRNNKVIKIKKIGQGGFSGTYVDRKMIFKYALEYNASGIILGHNHPSGNLKPSQEDLKLTKAIVEGGKMLDIAILDHIIVGDKKHFSFLDSGLI